VAEATKEYVPPSQSQWQETNSPRDVEAAVEDEGGVVVVEEDTDEATATIESASTKSPRAMRNWRDTTMRFFI
jgi:hypothetical protein